MLTRLLLITAFTASLHADFVPTGAMSKPRWGHTATRLLDGRILITGPDQETSAELFNPATGAFVTTRGSLPQQQSGHAATLLPDGRVLISGGGYTAEGADSGYHGSRTALLFNPGTETFATTGSLQEPRLGHTATRLNDGRVLIAGGVTAHVTGFYAYITRLATAELFDSATQTFTKIQSMAAARREHTATLLANGTVLLAGDDSNVSAEIFDPVSKTFTASGEMVEPRRRHTATLLRDGRVLIVGGISLFDASPIASAEIYDPVSRTFQRARHMPGPRTRHAAELLDDGRVLIVGGEGQWPDGDLRTALLYDPANARFSEAPAMMVERMDPTATRLQDGRVLITGGERTQPQVASPLGELFVEPQHHHRRRAARR